MGSTPDSAGIMLTNDHVVGASRRIRVKFDDSTRVEAVLLATDPKKDVAAIRITPRVASRFPILPLAQPSDTMIIEGEKVIAIGSPLHQEKIMTSGIVSKVDPTAVISDVNINHGNSGGPLLNMDGVVIAINTFGDLPDNGGPGISGSVLITEASAVLAQAYSRLPSVAQPSDRLLPVPPRLPFPLDSLQVAVKAKKFDHSLYEVSKSTGTGKFNVVAVTPLYDAWRSYQYEAKLAEHVKKREKKGGISDDQSFDLSRNMKDWMRYTGDQYLAL